MARSRGKRGRAQHKAHSGSKGHVDSFLVQTIHATNVLILLGSGASFCAKNSSGKTAPGMNDLWFAARDKVCELNVFDKSNFDDVVLDVVGKLPEVVNGQPKAGDIENLLSLCKMKLELITARANDEEKVDAAGPIAKLKDFINKAEGAILDKVDFVNEKTDLPAHRGLIQKFAKRAVGKPRVKVFTTNYDLTIEEAANRLCVVLVDGFSHSAEQRFNRDYFQHDIVRRQTTGTKADYVEGVFQLYKLHGSVDWKRRSDGVVVRSRTTTSSDLTPVLIYPRSTKYQEAFETPYLDMFAAFQAALREPDTALIIAGFGFADDHISAPNRPVLFRSSNGSFIFPMSCSRPPIARSRIALSSIFEARPRWTIKAVTVIEWRKVYSSRVLSPVTAMSALALSLMHVVTSSTTCIASCVETALPILASSNIDLIIGFDRLMVCRACST